MKMELRINKLILENFKGIESKEINFNRGKTLICGGNGTGKTSIFDGFLWLLFGKDSSGRSDFSIKTIDEQGNEIPKREHSVTGYFEAGGNEIVIKRILREKWAKKRGSSEEILKGNESVFEINGVNVRQSEFQRKISEITKEDIFKLLTNPMGFAGSRWQDQRKILIHMVEKRSDIEIAKELGMTEAICIMGSVGCEDRLKELKNNLKKTLKEAEDIPVRIDEISRCIKNDGRSVYSVENEIREVREKINEGEREIRFLKEEGNSVKEAENIYREALSRLKRARDKYNEEVMSIKSINASLRYEKQKKINNIKYKINDCEAEYKMCKNKIADCIKILNETKAEYEKERERKFNDRGCAYCGREWDKNTIDEKREKFNLNKEKRIIEFEGKINSLSKEISEYEKRGLQAEKLNEKLKIEMSEAENENNERDIPKGEFEFLENEVERAEINMKNAMPDTSQKDAEIKIMRARLRELECELSEIDREEKLKERIKELEEEEERKRETAFEIEKQVEVMEKFSRGKLNMLSNEINSRFGIVEFKLFDNYINGSYAECCEAKVKGVPFRDLNSAMKINAGLDIIRTLQNYYDTYVPVFVDNSESINNIGEIKSQLICLRVTNDDEIKII